MQLRLLSVFACFLIFASCSIFRKKETYKQQETYPEISDINSHQTPKEIAKDLGDLSKKQKRAYKKQLRKKRKDIDNKTRKWIKKKKQYTG